MAFYRHSDVGGDGDGDGSTRAPAPAPPNDAHRYLPPELFGNKQPISPPSPSDSDYHDRDPDHDLDHSDPDYAMSETTSHTTYSSYQYDPVEASLTGFPIPVATNVGPWSSYNTRGAYDDNPVFGAGHDAGHGARQDSAHDSAHDITHDALSCDECGGLFHGRYRNSNLARHKRQMHSMPQEYVCTVPSCNRSFRRPDARLKHERKKHPELMHPAAQRKGKGSEQSYRGDRSSGACSVSDHGHTFPDMELTRSILDGSSANIKSENRTGISMQPPSGTLTPSAEDYFAGLREQLGNQTELYETFFARWADIIEDLRNKGSDTHPVFAQALDALKKEAHLDNEYAIDSSKQLVGASGNTISSMQPYHRNGPQHSRDMSVSGVGYGGVASGRGSKRHGYNENPMEGTGSGTLTRLHEKPEKPKPKKVDCPIHKHHIMHGTQPPCGGFSAEHMSQIRHHLDPTRSNRHGQFPRFLRRCPQCKADVIDGQEWSRHALHQCTLREQHRGDLIARWIRLYLTLYPDASRVPSPYVDEMGWLPNNDPQNPFLGDHPQGTNRPAQYEPDIPPDPQSLQVAFEVILHSASTLIGNLLNEAARTLNPEQRRYLADHHEAQYRMWIANLRGGHQNQPVPPHTSPTVPEYGSHSQSTLRNAPSGYAPAIDAQLLPHIVNETFHPSTPSTQSSGHGYDAGSPQPQRSSMTSSMPPETPAPFYRHYGQVQIPDCPPTGEQMDQDLLMTGTFNDLTGFMDHDLPDPHYQQ